MSNYPLKIFRCEECDEYCIVIRLINTGDDIPRCPFGCSSGIWVRIYEDELEEEIEIMRKGGWILVDMKDDID